MCKKEKKQNPIAIYGARGEGRWKKKQWDRQFISMWITAQESNAIKWEWLLSRGVLRSLREPQIARLDTVFVMWLGDKAIDIC